MKKNISLAALMLFSTATLADAQGGFQGPSKVDLVTTAQLKDLKEDTPVILKGHILESLGNEEYTFQDKTGTVIIEVDHDDWNGVTVLPENEVTLEGEVEVERGELQVEVDRIQLTQS